jgi:putative ABC transport system substrate-binding protein
MAARRDPRASSARSADATTQDRFSWIKYTGGCGAHDQCLREASQGAWLDRGAEPTIEYRWACGQTTKFKENAVELVAAGAEVLVTSGDAAARAARDVTPTLPIVMASSANPVDVGLIQSLARPGGNVTGMTFDANDTIGKRVQLLKEVVPDLRRVVVLFNPDANPGEVAALQNLAPRLAIEIEPIEFRSVADLEKIRALPNRPQIGGIFDVSDPLVFTNRVAINNYALKERLPTVHRLEEYAIDGGLLSYGPDFIEFFNRAAEYVDKILKGARPDDLPVETPKTFRLFVNQRTAKGLGITLPSSVLSFVDEVIE